MKKVAGNIHQWYGLHSKTRREVLSSSVPHKLIVFALKRYSLPEDWINLIMAYYYDGLWEKTTSSGVSSDWMRYERGIFAGCTISVILFVAPFNVIFGVCSAGGCGAGEVHNGEWPKY